MNDLISRKALMREVEKSMMNNPHTEGKIKSNHNTEHQHFITLIARQPIAYDVDKVVEELEKLANLQDRVALSKPISDYAERYCHIKSADAYRQAILIVEGAVEG